MRTMFRTTTAFSGLAVVIALSMSAAVAQPKSDVQHHEPHSPDCQNCWVDQGMQDLSPDEQMQVMDDLYGLDGENTKNLTPDELAQLYADLGGEGNEDDGDNSGGKKKMAPLHENTRGEHSNSGGNRGGGNGGGGSTGGHSADGSPR